MYEKPALETFGTFRQLTQFGFDSGTDMITMGGTPGDPTNTSCTAGLDDDEFGCLDLS